MFCQVERQHQKFLSINNANVYFRQMVLINLPKNSLMITIAFMNMLQFWGGFLTIKTRGTKSNNDHRKVRKHDASKL